MNILALDTSSLAASCALWEDGRLTGEFFCNAGHTHSQTALPMVQALLDCTGRKLEEADLLAVSVGPGSFTGLRIGIAAVKGMAMALNKPCAAVSTLEGLAWNMTGYRGIIVPVMDARCSQVYTAVFEADGGGPKRLGEDRAISIADLQKELETQYRGTPIILVGDGAELCLRQMDGLEGLEIAPEGRRHQRAGSVCLLAARAVEQDKTIPADDLEPSYLRLAQAERELLEKQGGRKQ